MPAMMMSDDGRRLLVRLFEPTGAPRETTLRVPALDITRALAFGPFEVKTLVVDLATRAVCETNLLGEERGAPA
jgi:hypothetical protein